MIARLSIAPARKLKLSPLGSLPRHDQPLLDWSMQMFIFDRKQHAIIRNTHTLYSAVFLAGNPPRPQI